MAFPFYRLYSHSPFPPKYHDWQRFIYLDYSIAHNPAVLEKFFSLVPVIVDAISSFLDRDDISNLVQVCNFAKICKIAKAQIAADNWLRSLRVRNLSCPIIRSPQGQMEMLKMALVDKTFNVSNYEMRTGQPNLVDLNENISQDQRQIRSLVITGDSQYEEWVEYSYKLQEWYKQWVLHSRAYIATMKKKEIPFTTFEHQDGSPLWRLPFHVFLSMFPNLNRLFIIEDIELKIASNEVLHISKWVPRLRVLHLCVQTITTDAILEILAGLVHLKDLEIASIWTNSSNCDRIKISKQIGAKIYEHPNLERFAFTHMGKDPQSVHLNSNIMVGLATRSTEEPQYDPTLACLEILGTQLDGLHLLDFLSSPASANINRLHIQPFRHPKRHQEEPSFNGLAWSEMINKEHRNEMINKEYVQPSFIRTWGPGHLSSPQAKPLHLLLDRCLPISLLKHIGKNVSIVTLRENIFYDELEEGCLSKVHTIFLPEELPPIVRDKVRDEDEEEEEEKEEEEEEEEEERPPLRLIWDMLDDEYHELYEKKLFLKMLRTVHKRSWD